MVILKEATFFIQKVHTKGWVAKMASLYDRTKRAKPTCQDVMAFTAVELEFAMAGSEKIANV